LAAEIRAREVDLRVWARLCYDRVVSLVVLQGVSLSFGKKRIVDNLDLRIGESDKIGLIGPNGSGKSTLLKILSGQQAIDAGQVTRHGGLRLGYLPQDIHLQGGRTLVEFVRESVPGRGELESDLEAAQAELAALAERDASGSAAESDGEYDAALMQLATRVGDLVEALGHFEEHFSEHEALRILDGLGFRSGDAQRDMGEFSGGWKMRALLAALLFQKPDLLLLDEPTNHLDMPSVAWFSEFLRRYRRSFILICHDREFLNEQIERVVSFESEGVRSYRGNYEKYLVARAEEEIVLENKAKNLQREREKTEAFIDRFRAQATKAKAVQSRVKALEKLEDVELFVRRRVMRFEFPPCVRAANEVIKIRGIAKSYGANKIFSKLDLTVGRGQKIAIIGINGAGKTTLLRMIAGEIPADAGSIEFGANVEVGHFAQHHADSLRASDTVFETVYAENPLAGTTRVRTILGSFLFSGDDVDKKIQVLSGGERARVALSRLLVKPGNVLLLDEPTNHLDLDSSESLASSLRSYDGTVLFVSHNRSFVRQLADQIWNVHDGVVEVYDGTFDEYLYTCQQRGWDDAHGPSPARSESAASDSEKSKLRDKDRKRQEADLRRLKKEKFGPLQKEVERLELAIEKLEATQASIDEKLADPATYDDAEKRERLLLERKTSEVNLATSTEQWERACHALEMAQAKWRDEYGES
jgi:ATP-binding cassette subfamily F protein 3